MRLAEHAPKPSAGQDGAGPPGRPQADPREGRAQAASPAARQRPDTRLTALQARFLACRGATELICAPLAVEDHVVQPAPFVSPPKWHLAHSSWFFERFLLERLEPPRERLPDAALLFNSYYKSQGEHWLQGHRGHLSRPTLTEVLDYRRQVSEEVLEACERGALTEELLAVLELGIEHECQHQELLLMDIKFIFAGHPRPPLHGGSAQTGAAVSASAWPAAGAASLARVSPAGPARWLPFAAGLREFGATAQGFAFDNERPRHRRWQEGFALADRLVSNGEYLAFLRDGGYTRPSLWLSDGWDWLQREGVRQPLYWRPDGAGGWLEYHLDGLAPLREDLPVAHLSYYEAEAYARWAGARLPSEFELECLTAEAATGAGAAGPLWQWSSSAYAAYPGYRPLPGGLGEYNGKFMCDQFVLRGGCVATPPGHWRPTYRNFFRAGDRWAFNGLRLARDLGD